MTFEILSITPKSANPMYRNDDKQCDISAPRKRHDDFPDYFRSSKEITATPRAVYNPADLAFISTYIYGFPDQCSVITTII
jgi:hypothetical protein